MNLAIYLPFNWDADNPSMRLRRINLQKILSQKMGIDCQIVRQFSDLQSFDNILCCHFDPTLIAELKVLRKAGKRIFQDHSENLMGLPYQHDTFSLADVIVCCSTKLAEITREHYPSTQVVVVPDMYEEDWLIDASA